MSQNMTFEREKFCVVGGTKACKGSIDVPVDDEALCFVFGQSPRPHIEGIHRVDAMDTGSVRCRHVI